VCWVLSTSNRGCHKGKGNGSAEDLNHRLTRIMGESLVNEGRVGREERRGERGCENEERREGRGEGGVGEGNEGK